MMQAKIQEHVQTTRRHAELVKGCVERLGSSASLIKTALSTLMAAVQGIAPAPRLTSWSKMHSPATPSTSRPRATPR